MSFRNPLSIAAVIAVFVTSILMSSILARQTAERTRVEKRGQLLQLRDTEQSLVSTVNASLLKSMIAVYEKELATPDSIQSLETSEFTALGSFVQDTQKWGDDWYVTRTPQLGREWFSHLEKTIKFENIKPGELTWLHLLSENGQVEFGLATVVQVKAGDVTKNKVLMAVSSSALLDSVSVLSKGVASQLFVVDREGYTYSYPEAQYVGAKIDSHPVVRAMLGGENSSENVGEYRALDGTPVFGVYEYVPGTNLAVIATTPRPTIFQIILQFFVQTGLVTLGLLALTLVAFNALLGRDDREKETLRQNLELAQKTQVAVGPAVGIGAKSAVPANDSLHSATNLHLKEIVKGIADYMRTPLTALLGQLQIAEHQDSIATVKATLAPTVGEARRIRDFIETLCNEVELPAVKREVVDALPILNQVVANYRALIAKYEINFEENFKADFAIRADLERVRSALSTLLLFAIETLSTAEERPRRLMVTVERFAGLGQIHIEGHGKTLDSEAKKQLFAPFKTKLQQGTLFGLDLVLAQARIEEMQGEVFIENVDTNGFRFVVRFATAMKVTADQVVAPVKETVESYPLATEAKPDEFLASKKLSNEKSFELPPAPEFALQPSLEIEEGITVDKVMIRKPKLRLEV